MKTDYRVTGGCLCEAVRYEAAGEPIKVACCHCENCRRSIGAAFAVGVCFPDKDVTWTNQVPDSYTSSKCFARMYCSRCGSSIAQHNLSTAMIWLLIGTLDEPETVTPDFHMFTNEQISWIKLDDGLPRHAQWPMQLEDFD
jgi:hypothetical protein